jgi:uncharacterized Zn-finger protein
MPSSDRPFRCDICYRRFSSAGSLKRHYDLEHTPQRRCFNCGKQLRDTEYHRC